MVSGFQGISPTVPFVLQPAQDFHQNLSFDLLFSALAVEQWFAIAESFFWKLLFHFQRERERACLEYRPGSSRLSRSPLSTFPSRKRMLNSLWQVGLSQRTSMRNDALGPTSKKPILQSGQGGAFANMEAFGIGSIFSWRWDEFASQMSFVRFGQGAAKTSGRFEQTAARFEHLSFSVRGQRRRPFSKVPKSRP